MAETTKALVVGISGCSSSGKTTLARLLRDIFPGTFILHQDDFYKAESELPVKDGMLDWDCAEAIDVPGMAESLSYIRQHASFPPTLESKEDQNSVGQCPVPPATISSLKAKVSSSLPPSHPLLLPSSPTAAGSPPALRLCLLDGFLLYPPSMSPLRPHLDVRLFLRTSRERAKARREARDGYVTLEGFWKDPPGFVDRVVWPNYVAEHGYMFEGGDVEGAFRGDVLEREGIRVEDLAPMATATGGDGNGDMGKTLGWAVDVLLEEVLKH